MKLHRFYIRDGVGGETQVVVHLPNFLNQTKNVLRLKVGEEVMVFDNSGFDFKAQIEKYTKDSVTLSIIDKVRNSVGLERETWLFASIVKKDKFEWIAEKATELGVSHIVPLISSRTEKKEINSERLLKILVEAAEQSGRATIPILHDTLTLSSAIYKYQDVKAVVWDPTAEKFSRDDLKEVSGTYIGPEGGWAPDELELFKTNKILLRSLGPQVLKSETAVVATLSQIVF